MADTVPLVLNGVIGARLHVPFPVAIRSSFGFYFSRFAVVVRMITALFWHGKQESRSFLGGAVNSLDSNSDLDRKYGNVSGSRSSSTRIVMTSKTSILDHSSHMAFVPDHSKFSSPECRHHYPANDCAFCFLGSPVSDLTHASS